MRKKTLDMEDITSVATISEIIWTGLIFSHFRYGL